MPEKLALLIEQDFGLTPIVATEIEFYLHGASSHFTQGQVVSIIETACRDAGIMLASAETERGPDQYEIALLPLHDISRAVSDTECFKALIAQAFSVKNIRTDFAAKPMQDVPGSGLHVHVHLEDKKGQNVFFRQEEVFSPFLLNAIGGLLAFMNPCMPQFAPYTESYDRFLFTSNSYLICPTAANIPLTVSWGTNNRTVAVRLPPKPAENKHIEHRVSGSDADVKKVIASILAGIHYGLTEKCEPGEPIYGDATLPQYARVKLAKSLEEAQKYAKECQPLKPYLGML